MKPIFYVDPGNEDFAPKVSREGDAGADIKAFIEEKEGVDPYSGWSDFYYGESNTWKVNPKLLINGKEFDYSVLPPPKKSAVYSTCAKIEEYLRSAHPRGVIMLLPGEKVLVNSGFKVILPPSEREGYVLVYKIVPRSGLCHSSGITVTNSPGIIDSGYRGWVKVSVTNNSNNSHIFTHGSRIAQGLCEEVVDQFGCRVTTDESELTTTERGEGGFGSTQV
jgi:dUTP pyrophosphatase